MADRTNDPVSQKALANLLDAVEGVLAYTWESDCDEDAAEAMARLRTAISEYGVVQRLRGETLTALERSTGP